MTFDVVICVGPSDESICESNILYTKKNVIGYRNIYLICKNSLIKIDGAITIDEKIFPFNIGDVALIHGKRARNGWYLQQLLKLYAGLVIPDILQKYLVIDCDTHFVKPTKFLTDDNKCIFTTGVEYHVPYFEHMKRLHPSLIKSHNLSGISHHTFFDNELVQELIKLVEYYHTSNEKPFWRIFLDETDHNHYDHSGASEYELYFTYVYIHHREKMDIRQLKWINHHEVVLNTDNDFISVHWFLRQ